MKKTQKNNITVNQTVKYTFNNDDKTVSSGKWNLEHIAHFTGKTKCPELRYVRLEADWLMLCVLYLISSALCPVCLAFHHFITFLILKKETCLDQSIAETIPNSHESHTVCIFRLVRDAAIHGVAHRQVTCTSGASPKRCTATCRSWSTPARDSRVASQRSI